MGHSLVHDMMKSGSCRGDGPAKRCRPFPLYLFTFLAFVSGLVAVPPLLLASREPTEVAVSVKS